MRIDAGRYVNVRAVANGLPDDVLKNLPAYHSITGCDTTSYPFKVGKVKPLKKAMKNNKMNLLDNFGALEYGNEMTKAEKFLQTMMYGGKENETIVQTRCKMYERQKQKNSSSLIPDESSVLEHLKRAKYQSIIWNQCQKRDIIYPDPEEYGWINNEGLKPCWFTCPQLPPSLTKKTKKGKKKELSIGYEADTEESESEEPPAKKTKRSPVQNRASDADISESEDPQSEFTDNTSDNFESEGSIDISSFDESDSDDSDYLQ